jgi:hypothetical protein
MLEIRRVVPQSLTVGSGMNMVNVLFRYGSMTVVVKHMAFIGSVCIVDMSGVIGVMDLCAR